MLRMVAIVGMLLVQASILGCANRIREASWVVVQTENFEIYSTLAVEEATALGRELEQFRGFVYAVTNATPVESVVPTRIYAIRRRSEYAQIAPAGTAGVMTPGLRENTIVLVDYSNRMGANSVILHEYTHLLLHEGQNRLYPLWYNEGLAELCRAVVRREDMLVLGAFPKDYVTAFRHGIWVSMDRIIGVRSYGDLSPRDGYMFYPESWALVHYLTLDREPGTPPLTRSLPRYLDLVEAGTPTDVAYRDAFGELPGRSGKKIRELLDDGKMNVVGIPIAKLDFDRSEPRVRTPSPVEVAVRLGQLHLRDADGRSAEKEFLAAIALDARSARAQAGMGDALKFQSRFEEAEPYFLRAVELDPKDPLNHLDLAEFYDDRRRKKSESLDVMRADLAKARTHYRTALELDPDQPEALTMLAATHLAPGEDPNVSFGYMTKAYALVPSSVELLGLIAEAHLAINDDEVARKFLARALSMRGEGRRDTDIEKAVDAIRESRREAAEKVGLESVAAAD